MKTEKELSHGSIMQLGLGFWASKTLLSAVELGLFTELAKGPADAASLAQKLGINLRSAPDFFDALVALGMLGRENGKYRNTEETGWFLDKAKPSYIGGILEMSNNRLYASWGTLTDALRAGKPQKDQAVEDDAFEKMYADAARLKEFLQAMTGISMEIANRIAAQFPWRNYKTFVDVGAAEGCLPVRVATNHPHLTGIGYDLAVVRPLFEEYVNSFGLAGRIRFESGDFFKDPLPKADVVVMGHILHDWNLEQKKILIRKAYDALPTGGAFLVFEALIDDDRSKNAFGLLMSLNMLIETPGGFDYTGADCSRWMKEAGFRETRVEHLVGPDSMVVGIK
ncbi:MAG TPA: methyltransferase [Verrucomicrobiae bacterium]|jgi:hypothetical protein|nr:methyltransferase [Verrucomicrobiae bacterium]